MTCDQRTRWLLRAAVWLHQVYLARTREQVPSRLVSADSVLSPLVEEICRYERHIHRASRRGLVYSQRRLGVRYERAMQALSERVSQMQRIWAEPLPKPPTLRVLHEELLAAEEEFGAVEFLPREQIVAVQTEAIVLEGVPLGAFRIVLNAWALTHAPPGGWYAVEALHPNPAGTNEEIVHPHVDGDYLCAGDATVPIDRALEQGRLCDFFVLVRSVLETYNRHSAYVELEYWDGSACHDCGAVTDRECASFCETCEHEFCDQCAALCELCSTVHCRGCIHQSEISGGWACRACSAPCASCERTCTKTELEDGLCSSCIEEMDNEQEHDHDHQEEEQRQQDRIEGDPEEPPTGRDTAGAHPVREGLAQTPVPLPRR